jgi:hypothetical protein
LEVILPAFVALLDPETARHPHDACLTVVLQLAQNPAHANAFKASVQKLEPARFEVLQKTLKRKAELDELQSKQNARKEQLAAKSQKEKINFASWGSKK